MKKIAQATILLLSAVVAGSAAATAIQVASVRDLGDLSLEQLSSLEVTSVSGRPESIQVAAASIYVITAQDIRRSGATSLPEALRLAPNLLVAQTSAGQWAVSARGFNDLISNKLLVLIDGRTIYSPMFAGVFWDASDVVLEDVDRIEVISGPGGTLWGANAVNGVINVVTRPAAQTQGGLVSVARSGNGGRETVRWGGKLGSNTQYRAYALAIDRGNTRLATTGALRGDAATRDQAGFRMDWSDAGDEFTLQGDAYKGGKLPTNSLAPELHGGNLMARWSSRFADGSPYKVQAYYDLMDRDDPTLFRNNARTADVQFTHEPRIADGQLLWGAGVRQARDVNQPTALVLFNPVERTVSWSNLFAQYQRPLTDRLQATAGIKFERNSFTGVELLPSLRVAWQHDANATTWAAASRAVRAPARIDREFFLPGAPPFLIAGGPTFQSEVANVYEIGHRQQVASNLSYSVTVFRQLFHGLRAGIPGAVPATVQNLVDGPVDGIEAWAQWQATANWRLSAGYLGRREDLHYVGTIGPGITSFPGLGNDPSHQWTLRSSANLGPSTEFDVMVRRVGALPSPVVSGYTAVDARLGFQLTPALQLSLLARNVLDPRHVEFNAPASASVLQRQWVAQITWQP
jgi:iron complex outermembrane receptor protein